MKIYQNISKYIKDIKKNKNRTEIDLKSIIQVLKKHGYKYKKCKILKYKNIEILKH